jgi:hypothetical protein
MPQPIESIIRKLQDQLMWRDSSKGLALNNVVLSRAEASVVINYVNQQEGIGRTS